VRRRRGPSTAPWIAIAIIAAWALGLVAVLVELGRSDRAARVRRAQHEMARYDGL
jgi:hypothetical protein